MDQGYDQEQPKTINEMVAKESATYVTTLWTDYQNSTVQFREKLNSYYRQYRGIPDRKVGPGLANVFVNETLEAVESIVAQEFHTIYSDGRRLMLVGREETDEKKEKLIEDLMQAYLDKMSDREKILRSLRQKGKYGTTVAKLCWNFQKKEVMSRSRQDDGSLGIGQEVKVVLDQPDLEYIDLLDFACDPGKPSIADMRWVIRRKRMTYDDMLQHARNGLYSMEQVKKCQSESSGSKNARDDKGQRLQAIGISSQGLNTKESDVYEFWGVVPCWWVDDAVDINSDEAAEMVESVIEVHQNGTTLRCERNPYWHQEKPFLLAQHIQVDDEAYGIGTCEIAEHLQLELNAIRNQLLDHNAMQIFPPLIRNRASGVKKTDIVLAPNKVIDSDLPGDQAVSPLKTGGNPMEGVQMEGIVKQDIRNASGATNPVQGVSGSGDTTAFEVSVLERRGSSRINISTIDFGEKFMRPMYRMLYKLIQQYVDTNTAIKIAGKEGIRWQKISPSDLLQDFDFIPIIPTDIDNRILVRNQLIQLLQALTPFYPQMNVFKIIRRIYTLFGYNDADEVIPDPMTERGQNDITDEQELAVLAQGQHIDVKYYDNHIHKISLLQAFLAQSQGKLSPEAMQAIEDKIRQHLTYLETLQTAAQQAQVQAGMQGAGGGVTTPNQVRVKPSTEAMSDTQRSTFNGAA